MDSVKSQDDKECVVRFAYVLQKLNRCGIPEFSVYSRFLDFFQTARDNNYRRSRKKKKKKKKGSSAPSCVQRARDDSSDDGASTRVCIVYTCTFIQPVSRDIYITPRRHCRTEKRAPRAFDRCQSHYFEY